MLAPTAAGVGIGLGGERTGLTSGGINTGRMTVGGAGGICRGCCLAMGGVAGRRGGGRIGGGGGAVGAWPSNRRRSSSSQLVGRTVGRGRFMGGGAGEASSGSGGAPVFLFIQVASAETTRRTNAVINESMLRQFYACGNSCTFSKAVYFGCGPGVPLPPMLSRMPVSAWMFRIR
jgi:hypothetical protein